MTRVRVAAGDHAALFTGGGLVVALGGAVLPEVPGLAPWQAVADADGFLLAPAGGSAGGAPVVLEAAPAGAVALVGADEAAVAGLAAWWRAVADEAPPVVVAAADRVALALLPVLAARLDAAERRQAETLRALAMLRAEYEETRETVGALARSLGHRPLGPLRQALATMPDEDLAVQAGSGVTQILGLVTAGIAAVALHLPQRGALRVRLVAAESGRVLGAWAVAEAAPGWLTLELPWPVGPLRETAMLQAEGAAALSLDAGRCEAGAAVQGAAAAPGDRALALRVWTAEPGSRFVLPRHLLWAEIGTDLPLAGVPLAVPEAVIAAAEALEGPVRLMGLGGGAPRPVATLVPESEARFALPAIARGPADLVRVEFAQGFGEPDGVEAALWVDGAFSGWRRFDAATRRCLIQLPVPEEAGEAVVLRAALRRGAAGGPPAMVELAGAYLIPTRP